MTAIALRSGRPAGPRDVRFGLALAASIVLHLVLLLPSGWLLPAPPAEMPPPLQVELSPPPEADRLATHPEPVEPAAAAPLPPAAPVPAEKSAPAGRLPPPRELQGRELDTALAALMRGEVYPRAAIDAGLEGRVLLLLTLDAAGRVTAVEVADSSGHALLDDAALRAAARVGSLPGGRRQVLLPVEFRLE
jgi:protein TonB